LVELEFYGCIRWIQGTYKLPFHKMASRLILQNFLEQTRIILLSCLIARD